MTLVRDVVTVGGAIAIAILLLISFWSTVPATYQPDYRENAPSSFNGMRMTGEDIEERVGDDGLVFTVRANYYASANVNHPYTSRVWLIVSPNKPGLGQSEGVADTDHAEAIRENLTAKFESGEVALIIMTPRTGYMIQYWDSLHEAFKSNYCRSGYYEQYDANLYEYTGDTTGGDCENTIETEWV